VPKLTDVALVTDGKYSRASHRFLVGHISLEAAVGGPIAIVRDGDITTINADTNEFSMNVSDIEITEHMKSWKPWGPWIKRGMLGLSVTHHAGP
jgi:dihydroxy-acid dehydratase